MRREPDAPRNQRDDVVMMEVKLIHIEVTPEGTVFEVMRVVDVKDAINPARLRIRE